MRILRVHSAKRRTSQPLTHIAHADLPRSALSLLHTLTAIREERPLSNYEVIGHCAERELRPPGGKVPLAVYSACSGLRVRIVVNSVNKALEMAYTADEVVQLFEGADSALDTICMQDSDDDLGFEEVKVVDNPY